MRLSVRFIAGVFAFGLYAGFAAENNTTASASVSTKPDNATSPTLSSGFDNRQVIETWGWIIAHEMEVAEIELSEAELGSFLKGVAAGFKGKPVSYDLRKAFPDVERMAKARREKVVRAITGKNETEAKIFFTGLDKNPNAVKLTSGIRYEIVRPGSGPCPRPEQTVNVHYLGHLLDGTEFTQMGPIDLVLCSNRFSSYLLEGLQKINKGGLMKLYIPPPPSEKEVAMYGIQPGSAMVFEVELLDLKDTPPDVLADNLAPLGPDPEPPPPSGYSKRQIIKTWGWLIARKTRISSLGLSEAELSLLTKGLIAGVKGQPAPGDLEKIYPTIETFVHDRREKSRLTLKQKQLAEMEAFFARLKKNKKVVELPSGLRYEIIKPGNGPLPKLGKTAKITYVGRLLNGEIFDRTGDDDSVEIWICDNPPRWMIPGWIEGLQKINQGGKIKLYVPPSLGYGDQPFNNAPPYSTLIYEIELLNIRDTPPPDNAATGPDKK